MIIQSPENSIGQQNSKFKIQNFFFVTVLPTLWLKTQEFKSHGGHPRQNWLLLPILYGTNLHFWNPPLKRRQWMGWKTIMKFWKKNYKHHSINLVSQKSISNSGLNSSYLTLLGLGLIKINDVSANFNNPRPSLILNY